MEKPIYFDFNATTPLDSLVLETMKPYFSEKFGNASSESHSYGWEAQSALEKSRKQVAQILGCDPQEIRWTSGSTESNNWVFFGLVQEWILSGLEKPIEIITSAMEHKSILTPLKALEKLYPSQLKIHIVPGKQNGQVSLADLLPFVNSNTRLISVMMANNETGVLNPVEAIGNFCQSHSILFHTDATQAVGKIKIDVTSQGIDFLSLSCHKIYGPKGIGALYIKKGIKLFPLLHGGSQESGLRAGTVAVPLVVGLGQACALAQDKRESEQSRMKVFFNKFIDKIVNPYSQWIRINGCLDQRLHSTIHLSFKKISPGLLRSHLHAFALSSGSACQSGSQEPSHLVKALGLCEDWSQTSLRLSFGRTTTEEHLDTLIETLDVFFKTKVSSEEKPFSKIDFN